MNVIRHNFKEIYPRIQSFWCSYDKPSICPHCAICCDPAVVAESHCTVEHSSYIILILKCTACGKHIIAVYKIENREAFLLSVVPQTINTFNDAALKQLSPRFMSLYNQSLAAKAADALDLAAAGYRAAAETLVKDYAIKELGIDEQIVKKKSFCDAINEYLHDCRFAVNTADIVRYLGNDAVHYDPKFPEYGFEIIDRAMTIFVTQMSALLFASHPPLERPKRD